MVNYNGNYTLRQTIASIRDLEPYDLTWVEEPAPPENFSGCREIRDRVVVPLAADEAHYGRFELARLLREGLVDVVQPNLGRSGGFAEARFVAKLATMAKAIVRPHVWNSAVGTVAALQFAGSLSMYPHADGAVPESILFEFDRSEDPLRDELLDTLLYPGTLAVPMSRGSGLRSTKRSSSGILLERTVDRSLQGERATHRV